jgi:branched-chain amino acid transport system ATP-binding protein
MLAVAMSLVARPALMMLDEPTLGLSPIATEEVLRKIKEISESTGCGVLIVEENIYKALSIGRRIYIIKTGEIILEEMADKLLSRPEQFWELF